MSSRHAKGTGEGEILRDAKSEEEAWKKECPYAFFLHSSPNTIILTFQLFRPPSILPGEPLTTSPIGSGDHLRRGSGTYDPSS